MKRTHGNVRERRPVAFPAAMRVVTHEDDRTPLRLLQMNPLRPQRLDRSRCRVELLNNRNQGLAVLEAREALSCELAARAFGLAYTNAGTSRACSPRTQLEDRTLRDAKQTPASRMASTAPSLTRRRSVLSERPAAFAAARMGSASPSDATTIEAVASAETGLAVAIAWSIVT